MEFVDLVRISVDGVLIEYENGKQRFFNNDSIEGFENLRLVNHDTIIVNKTLRIVPPISITKEDIEEIFFSDILLDPT